MRERFTRALCALAEALGRRAEEGEVFRFLGDLGQDPIFSVKAAWLGVTALRSQGALVGAYKLEESPEKVALRTPFLTWWQGDFCLVRGFSQEAVEITPIDGDASPTLLSKKDWVSRWPHPILISPPQPNVLVESLRGEVVSRTAPTFCCIYRFCEEEETMTRHLAHLVQELIAQAWAEHRTIVYVDELGLVPEETVKAMGIGLSEQEAYKRVRELLDREVKDLEKGYASYDKSLLYRELYEVLASQARQGVKLKAVSEDLTYELWKKIVERDHETDPKRDELLKLFLLCQLERLAVMAVEIIRLRWEVNDWERDEAFLNQIASLIQEHGKNVLILTLRTGAHMGIETRLPLSGVRLLSYALSEVPEPEYLMAESYLGLLWNNKVILPSQEVALIAARDVLSGPLVAYKAKSGVPLYRAQWEVHKALLNVDYQDLQRIAFITAFKYVLLQRQGKKVELLEMLREETENILAQKGASPAGDESLGLPR